MAEGGEDPKKSRTPSLTSPASFVGLTNDQLMEIAEHPRAFSQFCGQHRQQQTTASSGSSKDLEPQLLTPVRSCCSFVRFSASSSDELRLKRYLMSSSKDQHERDVCRQALQLEGQQMEQRRLETEEQLKLLQKELKKNQDEQDQYRIQVQGTAKVFSGVVVGTQVPHHERSSSWLPDWHINTSIPEGQIDTELPDTAEQFCQKLSLCQRPPVLNLRPTLLQRCGRTLKWLFCCFYQ